MQLAIHTSMTEVRMWKYSKWTRSLPQIQSDALTFPRNYGESLACITFVPVIRGSSFLHGPFQCLALPPGGQNLSSWAETTWGWQRQMLRREEDKLLAAGRCLWKSLGESAGTVWAGTCESNPERTLFFFLLSAVWMYNLATENWVDAAVAALGLSTGCTLTG